MKTIGYRDRADGGRVIREYTMPNLPRLARIQAGLAELRTVGNIAVYLINNKKTRFLFKKGF